MPQNEYYQWRMKAQKNGLLHKATQLYYIDDSKQLYSIAVDDKIQTVPIFTYREWITNGDINMPISSYTDHDEPLSSYDTELLEDFADYISYVTDSELELNEIMWNDPVYGATDGVRRELNFELTPSDYYTVRSHAIKLENEMLRSFYQNGIEPDIKMLDIQSKLSELNVPYREKYASTLDEMLEFKEDSPRMVGGNSVIFFKTEDSYKFPIIRRDDTVSEARGWLSFIPAGVFQPSDKNNVTEPDLFEYFTTEYTEYFGDNPKRTITDLLQDPDSDSELVHTSTGIDCKNTNLQIFGAMVINDETFYENVQEIVDSRGMERIELVDIKETEKVKALLSPSITNPYNVLGLSEGLQYLKKEYDSVIGCDISRLV